MRPLSSCQSPLTIKNKLGEQEQVSCGKCPHCVARLASQWSFRLTQEDLVSTSSQFITLTYGYHSAPISKKGFLSLSPKNRSDISLFIKRMRHIIDSDSRYRRFRTTDIKYYGVGEYGGVFGRPHYHILLFNSDYELVRDAWSLDYSPTVGREYSGRLKKHKGSIELVKKKFRAPLGNIHFGTVTGASIGYCLKYMMKKGQIPVHKNDDRVKEYALMSKGLGISYLQKCNVAWHRIDVNERMFCNTWDGKKISMPRYYKEKIYTEAERKRVALIFQSQIARELAEREGIKSITVLNPWNNELVTIHDYDATYQNRKNVSDAGAFALQRYNSKQNQTL